VVDKIFGREPNRQGFLQEGTRGQRRSGSAWDVQAGTG